MRATSHYFICFSNTLEVGQTILCEPENHIENCASMMYHQNNFEYPMHHFGSDMIEKQPRILSDYEIANLSWKIIDKICEREGIDKNIMKQKRRRLKGQGYSKKKRAKDKNECETWKNECKKWKNECETWKNGCKTWKNKCETWENECKTWKRMYETEHKMIKQQFVSSSSSVPNYEQKECETWKRMYETEHKTNLSLKQRLDSFSPIVPNYEQNGFEITPFCPNQSFSTCNDSQWNSTPVESPDHQNYELGPQHYEKYVEQSQYQFYDKNLSSVSSVCQNFEMNCQSPAISSSSDDYQLALDYISNGI